MKTLRIGTPAIAVMADSNIGNSYADSQLYFNTNNALVKPQMTAYPFSEESSEMKIMISDNTTFLPNLCESWELSPDNKSIIFRLNRNLQGHWGNELTTEDIEYSIKRYFTIRASGFYFLTSFAGIQRPEYVRTLDRYSFEIFTPHPTGNLLKLMSSPWITFSDSMKALSKSTKTDPWSTKFLSKESCSWGPFRITDWKPSIFMELSKCDDILNESSSIDKVILREIPDSRDRIKQIQNGDIDIAEHILPEELDYANSQKNIRVISTKSTGVYQIVINCQHEPLNSPFVRQALNYICPQDDIINTAFHKNAVLMDSPCSPLQPGYTGEYWKYDYNPDKAAELLDRAGYSKGLKLSLMLPANSPQEELSCLQLKDAMADINIDLEIQRLPIKEFNKKLYIKDYMLASKYTFTAVRDPAYWGLWFKSNTFLNYSGIADAELDNLLENQNNIHDAHERADYTKHIQEKIIDLCPMIFIAYPKTNTAIRNEIGGEYHFNPDCLAYDWSMLEKF